MIASGSDGGGHVGHLASELGRRQGDTDNDVMPTGQSAGLVDEIVSAADVVSDVVAEAIRALERLTQWSHV